MPVSRKSTWRKLGLAIGVALLALLGIAQLFKKDLLRLHFVLTLFQPPAIVENFRSMTRVLDHRTVRRSGPTYRIPLRSRPLPQHFMHDGRRREVRQWLAQTATCGMVVVHEGAIAYERYDRGNSPQTLWISWSAGHPFISALVGCAMEEGLIRSESDVVTDYVPLLKTSGYAGVTLRDALQMASGVEFDQNYGDFMSDINRLWRAMALGKAMDDLVAALDRIRKPGTLHHPIGPDAQVLAMVLRQATGRSLSTYMEEKLWSRLGAEADAFWLVDSRGMELAFCGPNAVLRDYARFGLLFLNGGKNFRGQQILPARWVSASVAAAPPHGIPETGRSDAPPPHGYGYQWQLPAPPDGDYCAIGEYGQFIYVHPRFRVVIAKISADADYLRSGKEMEAESLAALRAIAVHLNRNP